MRFEVRVGRWVFLLALGCGSSKSASSAEAGGGSGGTGNVGGGGTGQTGGSSGAGSASGGASGSGTSGSGGSVTAGTGGYVDDDPPCVPLPFEPGIDATFVPSAPTSVLIDLTAEDVGIDAQNRPHVTGGYRLDWEPGVVRFSEDGEVDTAFGNDGIAVFLSANVYSEAPSPPAIDPLGRVWVGVHGEDGGQLMRFTDMGELDATFAASGATPGVLFLSPRYMGAAAAWADVIFPESSGAWFVGAQISDHLLDDGSYDPTVTAFATGYVIAVGHGTIFGSRFGEQPGTVRAFDINGLPRVEYGDGGVVDLSFGPGGFEGEYLLSQSGGRLVVANDEAVLRLTASGQHDTTFGTAGIATITDCNIAAAARVCEGRIVLAGFQAGTDPTDYCALILTRDGVPIPESPPGGMFRWPAPDISSASAVAIEPVRGRIVYQWRGPATNLLRIAPPGSG
jgi:hypothetical protein